MAETDDQKPKRISLGIKIALSFLAVFLLLLVVYFIISTPAFVRAVVLPRVGNSLNATVRADVITFKPFSGLVLRNVTAHTFGPEPLLTADELRLKYRLFPSLRGKTTVEEFSLLSPVIEVIKLAEGTNLDPLVEALSKPSDPEKTTRMALRNVAVHNGTVRIREGGQSGGTHFVQLGSFNFQLDRLENGQPGKTRLSAELLLENQKPEEQPDRLTASLTGGFDYHISPEFTPQNLQGNARLDVLRAEGLFGDLEGISAVLDADMTPTELRQVALRLMRGEGRLGYVQAAGPLDLAKSEGRIRLDIQSIDRHLLNLVGGVYGYDFARTSFSATNVIDIARQGNFLSAQGQLRGTDVSLQREGKGTPLLDLAFDYQVSLNRTDLNAIVQRLDLLARQEGRDLVQAGLDRPMHLSWGRQTRGFTDSTLTLNVTDLDLFDWAPILGQPVESGLLNLQSSIMTQEDGKILIAKSAAGIRNLSGTLNDLILRENDLRLEAEARVQEFHTILVESYLVELAQGGALALRARGSARYDRPREDLRAQMNLEGSLAELAQWAPEQIKPAQGNLRLTGNYAGRAERSSISGNLSISDFNGSILDIPFDQLNMTLDLSLEQNQDLIRLHRAGLAFRRAFQPAGNLEVKGRWDSNSQIGEFNFNASELNQNLLGPVLSAMGDAPLIETVSISGAGVIQHNGQRESSSVEGGLAFSNLRWASPGPPRAPLAGQIDLNSAMEKEQFELRPLRVSFQAGQHPAGRVELNALYHLANERAEARFKIEGINENLLAPWIDPYLGQRQLATVLLSGSGNVDYSPKTDSAIQVSLSMSELRARDPQDNLSDPLQAAITLDGTLRQQLLELRQCSLSLSPTARAKNQATLLGELELNPERGRPSRLVLRSESLDFTPFYELFSSPANGAPVPAAQPAQEPEPFSPAFQPLQAEIEIGRFYLRDLEVAGLATAATLEQDVLRTVKPLRMTVNGAPVEADANVNLSVPGYAYQLSFEANHVPIEPLANSFSETPGRYQGDLIARAQIQGRGTTGPFLRQHLEGQFSLSLTNLHLEVVGPRMRQLLDPVALALRIPELTQTPINWVDAQAQIGQGQVQLDQFAALSHAFVAEGRGVVQLADVLTNSPVNIPVTLSLRRSLAQKALLIAPDASPDEAYIELPPFVRIAGTLGDPQSRIDKAAISGLLLRAAGRIPQVGERAGEFLQDLGDLLAPPPPPTDPTQTNQPPRRTLFDLLRPLEKLTEPPPPQTPPPGAERNE